MKKRKTYHLSRFKNTTISNILLIQNSTTDNTFFLIEKKKWQENSKKKGKKMLRNNHSTCLKINRRVKMRKKCHKCWTNKPFWTASESN